MFAGIADILWFPSIYPESAEGVGGSQVARICYRHWALPETMRKVQFYEEFERRQNSFCLSNSCGNYFNFPHERQ